MMGEISACPINGNLTNAASLRQELAKEGHVFQTTVDSEVVLSLIARSRKDLGRARSEAANAIKVLLPSSS